MNVTGEGVTRYQKSEPKGSWSHNLDTGEKTYSEANMTTRLSDSQGDGTNASAKFGFHVSGNNDLVPGSWDIDAKGNMNISTVQGEDGSVSEFNISVNFNKEGAIQSVMYNGNTYSVEDWNKQFIQQDPQSDVKTKRN